MRQFYGEETRALLLSGAGFGGFVVITGEIIRAVFRINEVNDINIRNTFAMNAGPEHCGARGRSITGCRLSGIGEEKTDERVVIWTARRRGHRAEASASHRDRARLKEVPEG